MRERELGKEREKQEERGREIGREGEREGGERFLLVGARLSERRRT